MLTSPNCIICIIIKSNIYGCSSNYDGKISVFICKECQQRVCVTHFVFVVLSRDSIFFLKGLRWWAELLNVCSLFRMICYFYCKRKKECKDQSPTLLFRQNLAFRRFFTVIHNLHWLIDFKCCQLCCSFRFVASFKFSRAHSKFSPHYLK